MQQDLPTLYPGPPPLAYGSNAQHICSRQLSRIVQYEAPNGVSPAPRLGSFPYEGAPRAPPTPLTVQILSEPLQKLVSGRFNDSLKSGPAVGAWRACLKSQYSSTKLTPDSPGR